MDTDFAVLCPLVRHRMPQIQFLYIGSRLCSALLSGPASRRVLFHPCASLSLHVHHVVKRTFTSKRSNMLGTSGIGGTIARSPLPHHPACGSAPGGSVRLGPCGPEGRFVFRHKGFAARLVSVSASPSSEPVKLSRG